MTINLNSPVMRPYIYADHTDEENERLHTWMRNYLGPDNFLTYEEHKRLHGNGSPALDSAQ